MNKDIIPDIIDFWLADSRTDPERAAGRRDWWYKGGPADDEEITRALAIWYRTPALVS